MLPLAGRCIQTKSDNDEAGERGDQRDAARVLARRRARWPRQSSGSTVRSVRIGNPVVEFVHGRLLQNKNCGERDDGRGQDAQVVLHAAALHARQQAAAVRELFAGFVEAAVDPVDVEQAVELRPESEEPCDERRRCRPTRGDRASRPRAPTTCRRRSPSRRRIRRHRGGRASGAQIHGTDFSSASGSSGFGDLLP